MAKLVVIITPIFFGSGTGAATYYQLLVNALNGHHYKFIVISEIAENPTLTHIEDYYGILPKRTGKDKQVWRDRLIYGWQNLNYLRLFTILKQVQPDIVLVHSSFYNFPGIFSTIVQFLIKLKSQEQAWICDVRDVLLPLRAIKQLFDYNAVIACSTNVAGRLVDNGLRTSQLFKIPIIQESLSIGNSDSIPFLSSLNLESNSYIFYAGMIKEIKAVDLLLEAFTRYVHPVFPDVKLLLAGYLKTSNSHILKLLKSPGVCYLKNQDRQSIHRLMASARLCINLSPYEALSRSSLEAIALKRPVLLPPNIPEFEQHCPDFVVRSRDPKIVAERIVFALHHPAIPNYPIEEHLLSRVINQYKMVFDLQNLN